MSGQGEAGLGGFVSQLPAKAGIAEFGDNAAFGADNKQVMGGAAGVVAGYPGIGGVQPMGQPLFNQKIQGPVNRRGGGTRLGAADFVKKLVGFYAALAFKQYFQHLTPYGRKAFALLPTQQFGCA